jgi:hypothetical protein
MTADLDEKHRLLGMRRFLDVHSKIDEPHFREEVIEIAMDKVDRMLGQHQLWNGEAVLHHLAGELGIKIETVRSQEDLRQLVDQYLQQMELGFGQIEKEFEDTNVYAVLLRRMNSTGAREKFVAVLNSQGNWAREYFSGFHEITHPILEPPQQEFRFRRRTSAKNSVEAIVDQVAGKIAFHPRFVGPLIIATSSSHLNWDVVSSIKAQFSQTSSLMAITKGIVNLWPQPVFFFDAQFKRRKNRPNEDPKLRIQLQGMSPAAVASGIFFPVNMRVPIESPAYVAYRLKRQIDDYESLKYWTTSSGSARPDIRATTSARPYDSGVYILISI